MCPLSSSSFYVFIYILFVQFPLQKLMQNTHSNQETRSKQSTIHNSNNSNKSARQQNGSEADLYVQKKLMFDLRSELGKLRSQFGKLVSKPSDSHSDNLSTSTDKTKAIEVSAFRAERQDKKGEGQTQHLQNNQTPQRIQRIQTQRLTQSTIYEDNNYRQRNMSLVASNSNFIKNKDQANNNNDYYSRSVSKMTHGSNENEYSNSSNTCNQVLVSKAKGNSKKFTQNAYINGVPVTSSIQDANINPKSKQNVKTGKVIRRKFTDSNSSEQIVINSVVCGDQNVSKQFGKNHIGSLVTQQSYNNLYISDYYDTSILSNNINQSLCQSEIIRELQLTIQNLQQKIIQLSNQLTRKTTDNQQNLLKIQQLQKIIATYTQNLSTISKKQSLTSNQYKIQKQKILREKKISQIKLKQQTEKSEYYQKQISKHLESIKKLQTNQLSLKHSQDNLTKQLNRTKCELERAKRQCDTRSEWLKSLSKKNKEMETKQKQNSDIVNKLQTQIRILTNQKNCFEGEVGKKTAQISNMAKKIYNIQQEISSKILETQQIPGLNKEIQKLKYENKTKQEWISSLAKKNSDIQHQLLNKQKQYSTETTKTKQLSNRIQILERDVKNKDGWLNEMHKKNRTMQNQFGQKENQRLVKIVELEKQIKGHKQEILSKENQIQRLNKQLEKKQACIKSLLNKGEEQKQDKEKQRKIINQLKVSEYKKAQAIKQRDEQIEKLKIKQQEQEKKIASILRQVYNSNKKLKDNQNQLNELRPLRSNSHVKAASQKQKVIKNLFRDVNALEGQVSELRKDKKMLQQFVEQSNQTIMKMCAERLNKKMNRYC